MAYTRKQIIERLEKISADMSLFYKSGCVNYRGRTSDTKEYYTEVMAAGSSAPVRADQRDHTSVTL